MLHRQRAAFTVIELVVVITIVCVLMALLLAAVQQAREASRRNKCQNNLRRMGVALLSFHALHGKFPAGHDAVGARDHSWATRVLPLLGRADLSDIYSFDHAWNEASPGVRNFEVSQLTLQEFLCPSAYHDAAGATDYGGNYGTVLTSLPPGFGLGFAWDAGVLVAVGYPSPGIVRDAPVSLAHVRDGAENTFMVLENAGRPADYGGQWANGHQCLAHDVGGVNSQPLNGIYSQHPGGANVLMAGGAARFLSEETSTSLLGALSTRAGNELIEE